MASPKSLKTKSFLRTEKLPSSSQSLELTPLSLDAQTQSIDSGKALATTRPC